MYAKLCVCIYRGNTAVPRGGGGGEELSLNQRGEEAGREGGREGRVAKYLGFRGGSPASTEEHRRKLFSSMMWWVVGGVRFGIGSLFLRARVHV